MGEIKQTNFRINSDTADQFRTFCEERGYNQAKGFDYLMEVLQTQHTKEYVPERRIEVEEFEIASRKLLSIYLQSVEFSKDTEERVRADFETALQKKDNRIAQLESEVELHKQSLLETSQCLILTLHPHRRKCEPRIDFIKEIWRTGGPVVDSTLPIQGV